MPETSEFTPHLLTYLSELSREYPNTDVALGKIARLKATLTLPKGTIHVVSDIHGESKKLKHIINNASGSLRLLVEQAFSGRLTEAEKLRLLNLIYYPRETFTMVEPELKGAEARRVFIEKTVTLELELLRTLGRRYPLESVERIFPEEYRALFRELLVERDKDRSSTYVSTIVDEFLNHGRELDLLRLVARMIRNLLISELVVAGDLGDRGERIDRVIEYLMRQPNVSITWGNHDTSWMGACLGDVTCIATVLRLSLRYSRLSQLEEGYGISLSPLEHLAESVYAGDPAKQFPCKGESWRSAAVLSRMQKAISIIQFKLEAAAIKRNPAFQLESRLILDKVDIKNRTVLIDGRSYPLLDSNFPTVNWYDPYALSAEEAKCLALLRESFIQSPMLWRHMSFVCRKGTMYLRRDQNLIFHACVPVGEDGQFLPLVVDGKEYRGRALFDAIGKAIPRAFREKKQSDLDLLWYLWSGPRSPLFGKDKMTTFENYFVEDKEAQKERNNRYFTLIHEGEFCARIFAEFGMEAENSLIVNGHVPVKIEQGESPLKRSGSAVTIDGAFSEAYGDKGYTLVLEATRTFLAQHHHFESVSDAIIRGADIIPTIQDLRVFKSPRRIADTEEGENVERQIELLELLIQAYNDNLIQERRL